jgi:hypothetical protein
VEYPKFAFAPNFEQGTDNDLDASENPDTLVVDYLVHCVNQHNNENKHKNG